jgi:uroporphyrin-III C-methyltransferase / precorrin-2 dehydrogenase / sirohydrochlorin ferrochelatase
MSRRKTSPPRMPQPARPPRMARLATLPLFFKLDGKRVVVAGGNEAAAWKAELLAAAGATVEVWAPDPCAEIEALAAGPPGGSVVLERRAWEAARFVEAELVVGAVEDEDEARRIFAAALQAGVPVNVIDRPAYCTFRFGAVVNRSPLVIGISTDGAAPVFGQAIRSRIEALLPAGFARWVEAAKSWRKELQNLKLGSAARRGFWERFATLALREPDRAPSRQDRDRLLGETRDGSGHGHAVGHVSLVGAGPGNPELLTLAAVRALRSADIILYDDLVAPEILDFARREAKRMLVGKTGHRPSCRQDDINTLMIQLARAGKRVVRLKAGDPMIFGRAGEEIAALRQAGISIDVVPGITAAQGAAASLEVSLTQRGSARRVQYVTGHAHDGRLPDDLDLAALADPAATTAVYMPLGTLGALTERLLAQGADPELPMCAVFNATRPDERIVPGTLATIHPLVQATQVTGPCLLLMGRALSSAHSVEQCDRDLSPLPTLQWGEG